MDILPITQYDESWSLNPAYLTPANMANFRPAYVERLKSKAKKRRKPL